MPQFTPRGYQFTEDGFIQLVRDIQFFLNNLDAANVNTLDGVSITNSTLFNSYIRGSTFSGGNVNQSTFANGHISGSTIANDCTIYFDDTGGYYGTDTVKSAFQQLGSTISSHIGTTNIHYRTSNIDHTTLLNIGTNSHSQIDSHIATSEIHVNTTTYREVFTTQISSTKGDIALTSTGTLYLTSPVYDDENIAGQSLGGGASEPDTTTIPGTGILIKAFDGNATLEKLGGTIELPHRYKEGTDVIAHLHWVPFTTTLGQVEWNLECNWSNVNGTVSTSASTYSVIDYSTGSLIDKSIDIATISGAGKKISSHFNFTLYRNPLSTNDTYGGDAGLLRFGLHYQVDTLGSRQTVIK